MAKIRSKRELQFGVKGAARPSSDSALMLRTKVIVIIAPGKADYRAVRDHALEMFRQKFVYYSGRPFSRCGKRRRYMKLVETRPQRLFCSTFQETYWIPNFKVGVLHPYGEKKSPLDEFELVYWHGTGEKLALCPFCYDNPPFESMKEGDGCINCPHPELCGCLQKCGGVMVLDPQSHPKWRLTWNRCPLVVAMFDGALKLRCEARIVCAECKGKSPLSDEKSTFKGCLFCDESVKDLVNLHHAFRSEDDYHQMMASQRGRRGGGGPGRSARGRCRAGPGSVRRYGMAG
ncbi:unnamed protein product [Heligmosomoides polygyrus]|uniref:DNA topoisomerase n=1 Tax=Heligmosomoides polygyrus TaxID=6339 RepID=A0A183G3Q6_HELPZ|nr:unnamed protein product [Heligmosomoides polygyrus]